MLYVISLRLRHPQAAVLPVVFVTDPVASDLPDRWSMSVLGVETLSLRVRIVRVTAASIPQLHQQAPASRVAAALLALAYGPGIESALRAGAAFAKAPGTIDDFKRLLPFIEDLAKLTPKDKAEYRRRLTQEPDMSIIEEWLAETKAEGELAVVVDLVAKGRLSIAAARAEIAELVAGGTVTLAQAKRALAKLPKRAARRPGATPPKKRQKRRS